jgi:TPR repeat protein
MWRHIISSHTEAARYRLAAEQNFVRAQYKFGSCLEQGRGVAQDHAEAVRYYRLAAEQDDTEEEEYSRQALACLSETRTSTTSSTRAAASAAARRSASRCAASATWPSFAALTARGAYVRGQCTGLASGLGAQC